MRVLSLHYLVSYYISIITSKRFQDATSCVWPRCSKRMSVFDQSKLRMLREARLTELPSILGYKWRRKWGAFTQWIRVTQIGLEGPRARQLRAIEGLNESVRFFALTGADSNPARIA